MRVAYRAPEYRADDTFEWRSFELHGDEHHGWTLRRDGRPWLEVGPGYRLLRSVACGVCSTDLDRRFLPFPLPQVIGHELVARDEHDRRYVVEINASPASRGVAGSCPDCAAGMARHCPQRLVLGIHDLPGGFGGWVLAPIGAMVPVPDAVPDDTAVLIEPFAAALRAVDRLDLREVGSVAVLGPRRLGMLVLAAMAARRRQRGTRYEIVGVVRRGELAETAIGLGADRVVVVGAGTASLADGEFDVVIDTTASPAGFEDALRLARREVHLKSTHGRPAGGLNQATALVVDELTIEPFAGIDAALAGCGDPGRPLHVAWLASIPPPVVDPRRAVVVPFADPLAVRDRWTPSVSGGCLGGADLVVVDHLAEADRVIRPSLDDQRSAVRPCGRIALRGPLGPDAPALERAILARGVRLSASRCGDFRAAMDLMVGDAELRGLGARFVTHRFGATSITDAFRVARSTSALKVVVTQEPGHAAEPGGS